MAANALPIRFTELLQVRFMADYAPLGKLEHRLTVHCVQLTHTEIDVRSSKLHSTFYSLQGHADFREAKIHRLQFLCESHNFHSFWP